MQYRVQRELQAIVELFLMFKLNKIFIGFYQ